MKDQSARIGDGCVRAHRTTAAIILTGMGRQADESGGGGGGGGGEECPGVRVTSHESADTKKKD
jgi:hypothetical protein